MSDEIGKEDVALLMDVFKYIAKSAEVSKRTGSSTAFALAESYKEKIVCFSFIFLLIKVQIKLSKKEKKNV